MQKDQLPEEESETAPAVVLDSNLLRESVQASVKENVNLFRKTAQTRIKERETAQEANMEEDYVQTSLTASDEVNDLALKQGHMLKMLVYYRLGNINHIYTVFLLCVVLAVPMNNQCRVHALVKFCVVCMTLGAYCYVIDLSLRLQ